MHGYIVNLSPCGHIFGYIDGFQSYCGYMVEYGRSGGFGYIGGHMKLGSGKMGVWLNDWLYVRFICIWPRFPLW